MQDDASKTATRRLRLIAFALTFGLMLSDYMSRQVMNAVFPFLKIEWTLTDTQLGSLVSVVALTVGVMSFPLSLVADRVGRVKSAAAMAVVWGLATIACGLSGNFMMMFIARASSALASRLAAALARPSWRTCFRCACIDGAGHLLAAGLFGSMLGVAAGGLYRATTG
jgi:MFS family permease